MVKKRKNVKNVTLFELFAGKERIAYRRQKVLELTAKNLNDREIARVLKVSRKTVQRDKKAISMQLQKEIGRFDLMKVMETALREYNIQMREAWADKAEAKSSYAKARFLELIHNISKSKVELFDKFGLFDRKATADITDEDIKAFNKVYELLMRKRREEGIPRSPTVPHH